MVWSNLFKPLLLLALTYFIYTELAGRKNISDFVPYNSFEIPTSLSPKDWQKLNDKYGTLVQIVNTTTFNVAYQLDNMLATFSTVLNNVGVGRFDILSVGTSTPLSLLDVVVQDIDTLAVTRFKRVDFIVESMNPFVIQKVLITPDDQFISSQNITPLDPENPNMFRLKNNLHLFYPYRTSDDDMRLTKTDVQLFNKTMNEKNDQLVKMATENTVPAGTVVSVPAMSLPSSNIISKEIVGAGPLHPISL